MGSNGQEEEEKDGLEKKEVDQVAQDQEHLWGARSLLDSEDSKEKTARDVQGQTK